MSRTRARWSGCQSDAVGIEKAEVALKKERVAGRVLLREELLREDMKMGMKGESVVVHCSDSGCNARKGRRIEAPVRIGRQATGRPLWVFRVW